MQKINPAKLGWVTLIFLLGVILWGAFVRASGSGAGCGSHWPLCNGQVLPSSPSSKTLVEFAHRISSGLSLILCVALFWSSFRSFPSKSLTRKAATASLIFIFMEALLGAGLVLLELVAENKSVMRAISLGVHLLNTFLLLGAVALTARWAGQQARGQIEIRHSLPARFKWASLGSTLGILLLGASGAMTALGDTLFPSASLKEGLLQDFSATSHFLIQLRVYHPAFSLLVSLFIVLFAQYTKREFGKSQPEVTFFATLLMGFQVMQLLLGFMNILLLAPTVIQLAHLLVADGIWISLIMMLSAVWVQEKAQTS